MWEIDGYGAGPALGHGSAGTIVSARDALTGADVAIRYLARELSTSPGFMAGFRTDMARLEVIEQANVALVYELIEKDNQAALVTELIDGPSLGALLRRGGPLPPDAAVYAMAGILTGLAAVHDRGIVHGAVGPESVLVDPNGVVKVVDVGLAVPGKVGAYAAPEVQRGEPASTSADIFSVYAMLLECLTGGIGQHPGSGIPPALRVAFSVGLAEQQESRYQDANSALAQLKLMAAAVFGPDWYATGRESLLGRMAAPPLPFPVRPLPVPSPRPAADELPPPAMAQRPEALVVAAGLKVPASLPVASSPPGLPLAATDLDATAITPVVRPLLPTSPPYAGVAPPPASWPPVQAPPVTAEAVPSSSPPPAMPSPPPMTPPHEGDNGPTRHRRPRRGARIAAALVGLVLAAGGTAWAIVTAQAPSAATPNAVTTHVRVPIAIPAPTVPVATASGAGADTLTPATPAGLRVTGRSTIAVSLDWVPSVDNVNVAGYVIIRDGKSVGTAYEPGFTDNGLSAETKYTYAVTAFDEAGNVSTQSSTVTAVTLAAPDVSPPTVPDGLRATGRSVNSIVLAWTASRDNVGVAGYEVYRDGTLIANVPQPGYTDTGLAPASTHRYTVRAFDASNNASADSAPMTVATLQAPDTSPPSTPAGLGAIGTGPNTIDVSWQAAHDNVGVTKYQLFRDGTKVADVAGTSYTDQGLTADTSYSYTVRAVDAANNASAPSAPASAHTTSPPPPPTPDPTIAPTTSPPPEIMSVELTATPISDCKVHLEAVVTASAPTDTVLSYSYLSGVSGSVPLTFTNSDLTQTINLPDGDALLPGLATASAGGVSDTAGWLTCVIDPPTTEADPTDPPT
jgi:serine/threonine protein kinase/chitodextrinase